MYSDYFQNMNMDNTITGNLADKFGVFIALHAEAVARKGVEVLDRGINDKLRRGLGLKYFGRE